MIIISTAIDSFPNSNFKGLWDRVYFVFGLKKMLLTSAPKSYSTPIFCSLSAIWERVHEVTLAGGAPENFIGKFIVTVHHRK